MAAQENDEIFALEWETVERYASHVEDYGIMIRVTKLDARIWEIDFTAPALEDEAEGDERIRRYEDTKKEALDTAQQMAVSYMLAVDLLDELDQREMERRAAE